MVRIAVYCILVLGLSCTSTISEKQGVEGELINFGLVKILYLGEKENNPNSVSGFTYSDAEIVIVEQKSIIPLKLGVTFGIEWCVQGIKEKQATFEYTMHHPKLIDNKGNVRTSTLSQYTIERYGKEYCNIDAYSLDMTQKLIEGQWDLSISYQGKQLARKVFETKWINTD